MQSPPCGTPLCFTSHRRLRIFMAGLKRGLWSSALVTAVRNPGPRSRCSAPWDQESVWPDQAVVVVAAWVLSGKRPQVWEHFFTCSWDKQTPILVRGCRRGKQKPKTPTLSSCRRCTWEIGRRRLAHDLSTPPSYQQLPFCSKRVRTNSRPCLDWIGIYATFTNCGSRAFARIRTHPHVFASCKITGGYG